MDKILDTYTPPRLNQGERKIFLSQNISNSNRIVFIKGLAMIKYNIYIYKLIYVTEKQNRNVLAPQ